MKTVHEVSKLTGVSIRALQYYDKIGLLHPSEYTKSGYRLYDDTDLEKLQQILLFRELEFPLKDIKKIMESPDFDRGRALDQQITLLTLKKEHLENLIVLARGIKMIGVKYMNFTAFDTSKLDEYAAQAKASWGDSPTYKEFEQKQKDRTPEQEQSAITEMLSIFIDFGKIREKEPSCDEAQYLVKRLQNFFTENFYTCSDKILSGLGKMYAGGGDFTKNIDETAGGGTSEFVHQAIEIHCKSKI